MDEVVTCKCGNQSWIIGTSGIRCEKCQYRLSSNTVLNKSTVKINKEIDNE